SSVRAFSGRHLVGGGKLHPGLRGSRRPAPGVTRVFADGKRRLAAVRRTARFCEPRRNLSRGLELLRRTLIQRVLPLCFCVVPLLAALLIAVATPKKALGFYLEHVRDSRIDWIILTLGVVLFAIQLLLSWRALQWRATGF